MVHKRREANYKGSLDFCLLVVFLNRGKNMSKQKENEQIQGLVLFTSPQDPNEDYPFPLPEREDLDEKLRRYKLIIFKLRRS